MTRDTMPACEGMIVLAEARRRVEAEHGPRPNPLSVHAPRPSWGSAITCGWYVSPKQEAQFIAGLNSFSDARAWDRLVVAEVRRVAHDVSCGTITLEGMSA